MLFTFNLQMFNVAISGIDDDVLEQFKDELPEESEAKDQPVEPATADTHSDNKEDEQENTVDTEDEDEPQEGSSVPYGRFKGVNDRMKAAEARQRELEEELAKYKNPAAQQQVQASPAPVQQQQMAADDFNAEQIKIMTSEARRRAAQKLNLTDEDIENMDYSDDPNVKASYDALTAQYMGDVKQEIVEYQNRQQAWMSDVRQTASDYQDLCEKFNADPEHDAKWAKLCEAAQKRGERFMLAAQASIDRLNSGKGTSGDYYFVKDFMNGVLGSQQTTSAPTTKPNKKIQEAAKLPVAPSVGGSTKGDIVWDVPTITDYINNGRMDEIPQNILNQIMGQSIAPGDYDE